MVVNKKQIQDKMFKLKERQRAGDNIVRIPDLVEIYKIFLTEEAPDDVGEVVKAAPPKKAPPKKAPPKKAPPKKAPGKKKK